MRPSEAKAIVREALSTSGIDQIYTNPANSPVRSIDIKSVADIAVEALWPFIRDAIKAWDSESDEYTDSTHRTLPYAVWTKFPDESVEVIQMSGRNAVVAVRRIRSASSEVDEHGGS